MKDYKLIICDECREMAKKNIAVLVKLNKKELVFECLHIYYSRRRT
mgnify:CR=1 FL=1